MGTYVSEVQLLADLRVGLVNRGPMTGVESMSPSMLQERDPEAAPELSMPGVNAPPEARKIRIPTCSRFF